MSEIETHSFYGRFFYCPKCKNWKWFDRIIKIKNKNIWEMKLFRCMKCGTIVDWNGEEKNV
jgi:uncharacterized Zn finger protein